VELPDLQRHWNEFGKTDPLWAILMNPDRRGGRWDLAEFFQTGDMEIAGLMERIKKFGRPARRKLALDFGCGVGRLSQALCRHFDACVGIDIAPSMIELANRYNLYGARCEYLLNTTADLGIFPAGHFDFIYSNIVLQHMEPQYSAKYIGEFVRVLAREGVAVFQLPSEQTGRVEAEPLPDTAFSARITVDSAPRFRVAPQERFPVRVKVKNISPVVWPSSGSSAGRVRVRLGNHWLGAGRSPVLFDDARLDLPRPLHPAEEMQLDLLVTAPSHPARYVLEIDMLQEYVAWFKTKGSKTAEVTVEVTTHGPEVPDGAVSAPEGAAFEPVVEMYGIPRDQVVDIVRRAGGRVLDVQENCFAGGEWVSYSYVVAAL
jgi:SAM-dependent methyltransferase